jgi:NAD(P)-dependent dehydrogenase (short-subunit alcohol dehydrogenase family)
MKNKTTTIGISMYTQLADAWGEYCNSKGENISSMTRRLLTAELEKAGIIVSYNTTEDEE